MARINLYIENYRLKDYAGMDTSHCVVDCSLGVNPQPLPRSVMERLARISEETVKSYPHDLQLLNALCRHFSPVVDLKPENLWLGGGSFDLLSHINLLYAGPGRRILSYAPQFSAYADNARLIGADYVFYPLERRKNYAFDIEAFIACLRERKPDLVCVENPNNPTGQIIASADIEKILQAADEVGAAVVVDEAYGEYMPMENSAIRYVTRYEHVFVTRTFSKGYGMAGIRLGYAAGSTTAMGQLRKLITPYNAGTLPRELAMEILTCPNYTANLCAATENLNRRFLEALREPGLSKFKVAATSLSTPINLLYVENESVDLQRLLAEVGIAAVSGLSFDNLGANAVRIMIGSEDKLDLLLERLRLAAERLP